MNFRDFLTPEEREACWRAGFIRKLASNGVSLSEAGMEKDALSIENSVKTIWNAGKDLAKGTIALGLVSGIPLGILTHFIGRALSKDNKEVERLTKTRDTYIDVVEGLKRKLQQDEADKNKVVKSLSTIM